MGNLARLAKQNLTRLQKVESKIRKLYLESEPVPQSATNNPQPQQSKIGTAAPRPRKERASPVTKVEIDPSKTKVQVAFANKISQILHKEQKLKMVVRDFTNGKCSWDDFVDAFFESCENAKIPYAARIQDTVNILLSKGYTLQQDNGFLAQMLDVART